METRKSLESKPTKGELVKFRAVVNGRMKEVIGKVTQVTEHNVFIAYRDMVYPRFWIGLVKPTIEEEVLWKLEQ